MKTNCDKPLVKKIRTPSENYIYDSRSNRLLHVTKRMFEIIDYFDVVPEEQLLRLYDDKESTKHALNILRDLSQKKGLFISGHLKARMNPVCDDFVASQLTNGPQMMTLEVTDSCNLRCSYCIFSGGYKHYPEHGIRIMSTEVGRRAIDLYLSRRKDAQELSIGFYGGEPLLNFNLIQDCCEYALEIEKKNGQIRPFHFSITTNGTLLNDQIISWLMDHQFAITVSCDGPAHDKHRIFPSGKGSFDQVFSHLQEIYEKNPKYYENHILINCVLCPCSDLMEIREFFEKNSHLFGNNLRVSNVNPEYLDYFSEHPAYEGRHRDWAMLHKEYIEFHLHGKTSSKRFQNSFCRSLFERDYLQFHRRQILDETRDTLNRVNSCFPGERKIFVDVEGNLHVCERVTRHFPIGTVWDGYNLDAIKTVFDDFTKTMDSTLCRGCWAVQLCPNCLTVGTDGNFPTDFQIQDCPKYSSWIEEMITHYCEVLEKNPKAFDYMDDYLIA